MACFSRVVAPFALALVAIACTVALAPVAVGQPTQPSHESGDRPFGFIDRLFGGSERLGTGERGAPAPSAGDRTAQVSGPDLLLRLDRLEAQIRQLTGAIEQLQYRNQQLEATVRLLQEGPAVAGQPRPQSPLPAPAAPGRRGDAFDPTQHPNAPGAPQTLGSIPSGAVANAGNTQIGMPRAAPLDIATTPPAAAPPRAPGPVVAAAPSVQSEYDVAYGYVLRKDYVNAETSFRNFLGKHPSDRLAGDATYWYGESLYHRQRFRDAAEAFLNVSTKFESNAKAPDALLRLGQSLAALGEKEAACASLGEVARKFPRASASVKQAVEREQKRVRC
jgi:tol-pal system protein YbgF